MAEQTMLQALTGPSESNSDIIVPILEGYFAEADMNRKGGMNNRDDKWEENFHLYWNRYDFSGKAEWQAQEVMPEVPSMVDRFAAAMKDALAASPRGFYTVVDVAGAEDDVAEQLKKLTDAWLATAGKNQTGTPLDFFSVFEEQLKLGAISAMASVVLWKDDVPNMDGRVAIETVDPRNIWLDHTYRNLYRIRRTEVDKHALSKMVRDTDKKGKSIWNRDAISQLVQHIEHESIRQREEASGTGAQETSTRQTVTLDEYIATVIAPTGEVLADNELMVVGNRKFLLRGPEKNPFWHKSDWLTYAPLITAPLSVYGRSYMEDFGSVAKTFNDLTNMVLDAVQTASLRAYALVPGMLMDPEQATTGVWPNKTFLLEEGMDPKQFFVALDMGRLPPETFQVWSALKDELREAGKLNEIGVGQFAPNSRTSATEVNETQQSSSALIRSVAQTVETRWLNPTLDGVWKTGMQHAGRWDPLAIGAIGGDMWGAFYERRKEFFGFPQKGAGQLGVPRDRLITPYRFRAYGISMLIHKNRILRSLIQIMGIIAQSEPLLAYFMQQIDIGKFLRYLFMLSDIDMSKLQPSDRERLIANFGNQMSLVQGRVNQQSDVMRAQPEGGGQAAAMVNDMVQTMGVGR